jgi:DNA-binding MarR family transcriptional regulator
MSESSSFDLASSPGHLLHRAQKFASDQFATATGGLKITQRQFAVLCAVYDNEGLTQTQLVQSTGIDRSTLAELVSRMAANGLLVREKAPGDARANSVKLTEAGRDLHQTATTGARAGDDAILKALPKNKRANFLECLTRIATVSDTDAETLKIETKKAKAAQKNKKAKASSKAESAKKKKKRKK